MYILRSLLKREKKHNILTSFFKIAEKGMYHIEFPLSNEGRFEMMMFNIWFLEKVIEELYIDMDYALMQNRIDLCLKETAAKLQLSSKRKYGEIYNFRKRQWDYDIKLSISSHHWKPEQLLSKYMYSFIIIHPLMLAETTIVEKEIADIQDDRQIRFVDAFDEYFCWLKKRIFHEAKK